MPRMKRHQGLGLRRDGERSVLVPLLLGLGADELSMAPASLPPSAI